MRQISNKEDERKWQSKIEFLGPFCLLLWDDPVHRTLVKDKTLYRGADLTTEQIATYQNIAENQDKYGSFQAFSSCSCSRQLSETFGNTLFIMNVQGAFVADISQLSEYPNEEEELITPGVCFRVKHVEVDHKTGKHLIYLWLRQRFSEEEKSDLPTFNKNHPRHDFCDADDDGFDDYGYDLCSDRAGFNRHSFDGDSDFYVTDDNSRNSGRRRIYLNFDRNGSDIEE